MHDRVVIKVGGEAFSGEGNLGIDPFEVRTMADRVSEVHCLGVQVGLVVGAGNLFRGESGVEQGMSNEVTAHHMGMMATVINALALQDALETLDVPVRVMTGMEMRAVAEPYIHKRSLRHLEKGRIVIFGGGMGNPFFTTDTAAALRSREIGASIMIKATKVDGVYAKDPKRESGAEPFAHLSFSDAINDRVGVIDSTALTMCRECDMPIVIVNLWQKGSLVKAVKGEPVGTMIS